MRVGCVDWSRVSDNLPHFPGVADCRCFCATVIIECCHATETVTAKNEVLKAEHNGISVNIGSE